MDKEKQARFANQLFGEKKTTEVVEGRYYKCERHGREEKVYVDRVTNGKVKALKDKGVTEGERWIPLAKFAKFFQEVSA